MRVGYYLFVEEQPGYPTDDHAVQTLLQILAASNHRITILGADVSLQGDTPASTPIEFSWVVQSDVGTSTGTITAQKQDRGVDETVQGTFYTYNDSGGAGRAPTTTSTLIEFSLHRQGHLPWRPPFPLIVKGGERVALRVHGVVAAQGSNINTIVTVYCEE